MSRIGRKPVEVPSGVKVSLEGRDLRVEGPKGRLAWGIPPGIKIETREGKAVISRSSEDAEARALHGLTRALLANMIVGVSRGYERRLEIEGVGYRAAMKGKAISLSVGFSHTVEVEPLPGVEISAPEPTKVVVRGIDKQAVGQMAATIRGVRPPEPYKGKGIRYEGEVIRRKAGKAFVSGGA